MICLGCGADCKCAEPAKFKEWPLGVSLTRAELEEILYLFDQANRHVPLSSGVENAANAIRSYLQKAPEDVDPLLL